MWFIAFLWFLIGLTLGFTIATRRNTKELKKLTADYEVMHQDFIRRHQEFNQLMTDLGGTPNDLETK